MAKPLLPENVPMAQLTQDCIDAKAHGLSYGEYMAQVYMGKLERTDYAALQRKLRQQKRMNEYEAASKQTVQEGV